MTTPNDWATTLPPEYQHVPPHNLDAEEGVLAACLYDGAESLTAAQRAGLRPDSFFKPGHQILYQVLIDNHRAGRGLDTVAIMDALAGRTLDSIEWMRPRARFIDLSTTLLAEIGGPAELLRIGGQIDTTTHLPHWLEIVARHAQHRRTLELARRLLTDASAPQLDADRIAETLGQLTETAAGGTDSGPLTPSQQLQAALAASIGVAAEPDAPDVPPTLQVTDKSGNTVPIASAGNLTQLVAQAKAGKSSTCAAAVAAVIPGDLRLVGDNLGLVGMPNTEGKLVLVIDTEQGPVHRQRLANQIAARAGLSDRKRLPPWLITLPARTLPAPLRGPTLERLVAELGARFGGVHMVILDGVAQLVDDPNDGPECSALVQRLCRIAEINNCAIIGVLHLNPDPRGQGTKSRGHLGSELERLAAYTVRLDRKEAITAITVPFGRDGGVSSAEAVTFRWDQDVERHRLCQGVETASPGDEKARRMAEALFSGAPGGLSHGQVIERLTAEFGLGESAARMRLARMVEKGVVWKERATGMYAMRG